MLEFPFLWKVRHDPSIAARLQFYGRGRLKFRAAAVQASPALPDRTRGCGGLRRGRGDRLRASRAPKPRLGERVAPQNEHGMSCQCPGERLAGVGRRATAFAKSAC